eukprot:superscaffoldBa00007776_g22816
MRLVEVRLHESALIGQTAAGSEDGEAANGDGGLLVSLQRSANGNVAQAPRRRGVREKKKKNHRRTVKTNRQLVTLNVSIQSSNQSPDPD